MNGDGVFYADVFVTWLGIAFGFGFWVYSNFYDQWQEMLDTILPTNLVVVLVLVHQYFGWGYSMWGGAWLFTELFVDMSKY